jgi:hypothetical protein
MNYLWLLYITFYIVIISYYIVFLFYLLNLISRVYCSIFQNQTKFQNATVKSTIHTSNSSNTVLLFPFLGNSPNVYIQINDEIYALFKFLPLKKIVRQIHNWSCFFFALQFNFSVKRKWKQTGIFLQFIYLGIDHDHLMLYLNL